MNQLYTVSDIESIKSFEEKSDDFIILEELYDSKFKDCFSKIFENKSTEDIDSDNESILFCLNQKPTFSFGSINSDENKENTLDRSKDKPSKTENKEDNYNDLSSSFHFQSTLNINNRNIISKEDKELSDEVINIKKKDEEEKEKNESKSFVGKKRNLFKIDFSKNFSIFNNGEFNKESRQLINEVTHNFSGNVLNTKENGMIKIANRKKYSKVINVQKRKENSDNIRKKIKSRFLKVLKNKVNEKLRNAGSEKFFKFLPQKFISNISKEINKAVLNLSFQELFSKNFCEGDKENEINFYHNQLVLKYLENNKEICEKSNFNNFKNMKYYEIYNEYLKSKEFEMEITSLKNEKETDKYIKDYIIKASDLIDFFSN